MNNRRLSLLFCFMSLFACTQPVAAMEQERGDVNADVALLQLPDELLEQIVLFSVDVVWPCDCNVDDPTETRFDGWNCEECKKQPKEAYLFLAQEFGSYSLLCKQFHVIITGLYRKFFKGVQTNKKKRVGYVPFTLVCRWIDKGFHKVDLAEEEKVSSMKLDDSVPLRYNHIFLQKCSFHGFLSEIEEEEVYYMTLGDALEIMEGANQDNFLKRLGELVGKLHKKFMHALGRRLRYKAECEI